MSRSAETGRIIQNRVHDKIQFQTSFTDFPIFVFYCKCVKRLGGISKERINAVLGEERNSFNNGWRQAYDSHACISLLQYHLIKLEGSKYVLDTIGNELVEMYNENSELIGNRQDYLALTYQMITSWIQDKNGYAIHPGMIILKLMLEPELHGYVSSQDIAHIFNFTDIKNDSQYDDIVSKIVEFRSSGHLYRKEELKKTYTLLTGYVKWGIFELDESASSSLIKVVSLKSDFKDYVLSQINSCSNVVLNDEDFISLVESVDDIKQKIEHYASLYGDSGTITKVLESRISQVQDAFRDRLMDEFQGKCLMCEISNKEMLVASHIKRDSVCESIAEKIDNNNGLLLCANHDKLFDRFLISFDGATGKILISSRLTNNEKRICLLDPDYSLPESILTPERQLFLIWHNSEFYKKENGGN